MRKLINTADCHDEEGLQNFAHSEREDPCDHAPVGASEHSTIFLARCCVLITYKGRELYSDSLGRKVILGQFLMDERLSLEGCEEDEKHQKAGKHVDIC